MFENIKFQVNNKNVVRRLSGRSLKANASRNFIAVAAIALTTILFTVLFTVGSGMVENIQRQTMRQAGGDGMAYLKYITDEQFEAIKNHPLIDRISYNRAICEGVESDALLKRHAEIYYMNDVGMELGFCVPTHGQKTEKENEIIMDTRAMKMLGLPEEIGTPVTFRLKLHNGNIVERKFVLSGWWEADPAFNMASIMVVSKAYMDAHIDELYNSYRENYELTGTIGSYIMFRNSLGLEKKVERVITESGYSMDENTPNYIASNVNWSYLSSNFDLDLPTVAGVLAAAILIIFTGYLIIYNIFQISVTKDIRFYGLLKTIGTTGSVLSLIIGLIGTLNFINSMLTSIFTRRREFAMLQSVGMTAKQLRKMLIAEGLLYTVSSGLVSVLLSVLLSALFAGTIAKSLWFFTYHFTLLPLAITIPILLLIGILLPLPVLNTVERQSIVERLREAVA